MIRRQVGIATMGYEPWPSQGCNLAEVRLRIADIHSVRSDGKDAIQAATDALFGSLAAGKLIAYGNLADSYSEPSSIPAELWLATETKWSTLELSSEHLEATFSGVRVFPLLLAPDRAQHLDGKTLAEAFKNYVLEDPEVWALSRGAISKTPEYGAVYHHARCHPFGEAVWPIKVGGWLAGIASPEDRASPIGFLLVDDDPNEVVDAADALRERFDALFGMLRRGELIGRGLTVSDGIEREIPRSIWSHEDFYADFALGDIVQFNKDAKEKADSYIRSWMGVMLARPRSSIAQPTPHPLSAPPSEEAIQLRGNGTNRPIKKSQSTAKAIGECEKWLASEMLKSPARRVGKKVEAATRFGKRLSRRGFDRAWDMAVAKANATAWAQAGAPKKAK